VINLSPLGEQQTRCAWTHRRGFLSLGLAAALAGCAQPLLPKVQLPDWNAIKRGGGISFTGPIFERVKRVGQKVLPMPTRGGPWQFGVVAGDSIIVSAFHGNGLTISNGALDLCENDGQLGALLLWATMFPVPSGWISPTRSLTPDVSAVVKADVATLRGLAQNGFDPRDDLVIARRVSEASGGEPEMEAPRWAAMETALRTLGYQV
jgi:hypothetical protein